MVTDAVLLFWQTPAGDVYTIIYVVFADAFEIMPVDGSIWAASLGAD